MLYWLMAELFYNHRQFPKRMREGRKLYVVSVGKPEGKRSLGRPRRRWEDRIKMDPGEIGWGVWSGFTWLRIGIVGGLL
jgi:hypothetical protein